MKKKMPSYKIVEIRQGAISQEEVVLGIIRHPDAKQRAETRAERHRKEGKIVKVVPYTGKQRQLRFPA